MAEQKITFTTKEYKPQGNFMSAVGDPVFVDIEKINFPTKQGNKEVGRIRFFPNSSTKEEDIKNKLQMSGNEVKKLTFEITIDGEEIEVAENNNKFTLNASSSSKTASTSSHSASASASKEPKEKNDWENEILSLRNFKLADIEVKTKTNKTDQQQQKPDSQNTGTTSTWTNENSGQSGTDSKNNKKTPTGDTTNNGAKNNNAQKLTKNGENNPTPTPTPEEIKSLNDELKNATTNKNVDDLVKNINRGGKLKENISDNKDNKEELEKNLEAAKKELAEQDIKKYREEVVKKNLDNRLKENSLKVEDLSTTAKQNYEKLNSDTETNRQEIDKTEQEILTEVGKSSLDKLIAETEQALKSGDKKKIENKIKELQKFVNSQIDYKKNAYQSQKDKVQSLLEKSKTQQSNQNGFFRPNNPLMWVSGVAVIGLVVGPILVIRARQKKRSIE